jgi:hypothetical protein
MRAAFVFIFGLISIRYLPAQPTTLSGPVEAFTFDAPTRSLRAVIGFPGAASFGPALLDNLDVASVAPRQNYAIVFESEKCLFFSGLGAKLSTAVIEGVTAHPDVIVWSGDGSLAILYSPAGKWLQTIAGFPGAPVAGAVVDVSSLGGSLSAVAADSAGKQIAVAVNGENGAVYQTTVETIGGQFTHLASMAKPVSLSFSSDGQTLYALDAALLQVTAVSLASHGFQTLALPGMTNPVAIQSLQDSQNRPLLYVAGGVDRMLRILDVSSQQKSDVPLHIEPTSLVPFGAASFVITPRSQSANPLWLFASTPEPGAAYFVPAVQLRQSGRKTAAIAERTR